jgi:predicted nuclease of predicted toxin-antitoxin system
MKLLLDENLSRRLIPFLQHDFPGSSQVALLGLESAPDTKIWNIAKQESFVIVTRDNDFEELSLVWGHPPQVVLLKTSNQSRAHTLSLLISHRTIIEDSLQNQNLACIELYSHGYLVSTR